MNLRDIKKDIEYVISAFIDDCYIFATMRPTASDNELSKLFDEAVDLYNDLRDRCSEKPNGSAKAHFQAIRKDLIVKSDELYNQLSEVVKANVK